MFGDLAGATSVFRVFNPNATGVSRISDGTFTLPIAGGGSRIGKISENDSPIPRDRVFASSAQTTRTAFRLFDHSPGR